MSDDAQRRILEGSMSWWEYEAMQGGRPWPPAPRQIERGPRSYVATQVPAGRDFLSEPLIDYLAGEEA